VTRILEPVRTSMEPLTRRRCSLTGPRPTIPKCSGCSVFLVFVGGLYFLSDEPTFSTHFWDGSRGDVCPPLAAFQLGVVLSGHRGGRRYATAHRIRWVEERLLFFFPSFL